MSSAKDIAQRIATAKEQFARSIQELAGCSKADAIKIMRIYLKRRVAKLDIGIGRISVKHGIFLEKDVLLRARDL